MTYVLTFIAGALIEAACVAWVHYSERNRAALTAAASMAVATAQVFGIGESIHDAGHALCFVLGYGAGTFAAVKVKSRRPAADRSAEDLAGAGGRAAADLTG